jgi:serine/threonine protein kinase
MTIPEPIPTLPGFTDLELLGQGAYGQVFEAFKESDGSAVALKFCPKLSSHQEIATAAWNEIYVLSQLSHPNIVGFSAYHETEHFIILELSCLRGKSLQTILRRRRSENSKLDERFIVTVLFQVASALNYLDSQNVIHFDVKPNNIMIENVDPIKVTLIDFGISHKTDSPPPSGTLSSGTRMYLAPEIMTDDPPYTSAVDIWCLGMTLYQMLYLEFPPPTTVLIETRVSLPTSTDYSNDILKLCEEMLQLGSDSRPSASDILNRLGELHLVEIQQEEIRPRKKHFQYRVEDEPDIMKAVLLPTATVQELILYANAHGIPGDRARFGEQILQPNEELRNFPDGEIEIFGTTFLMGGFQHVLKRVYVVFVIDVTRSMEEAIQGVCNYVISIAQLLRLKDGQAFFRFACVCYRDPVTKSTDKHEWIDFTSNSLELQEFLQNMKATGGSDNGSEDFAGAVELIHNLHWREDAIKSVFWIADSSAPGVMYGGNGRDREHLLEPLIRRLAAEHIRFVGFALTYDAARTFYKFQEFYTEVDRTLWCEVIVRFKPPANVIPNSNDASFSDTIGRTLEMSVLGVATSLAENVDQEQNMRRPELIFRPQRRSSNRMGSQLSD